MNDLAELDLTRLQDLLQGSEIGHTVDYHRVIDSTMNRAHRLAESAGVRSGLVVVAEQQTGGKGRRGRGWHAPYARAVLVSILLKPPYYPQSPEQIPMAAGIAVCDALIDAAPELEGSANLKWPNDVLLGHGRQAGKVAGILAETSYRVNSPSHTVLGIGINVNQNTDELPRVGTRMPPPVSLLTSLGRTVDRTQLLAHLCRNLATRFAANRPADALFGEWRSRLSTLGQHVTVYVDAQSAEPAISGVAVDVTPSGDLIVEDDDGNAHTFAAADVSLRTSIQ